jgi:TM2 domain-containing membrane protein YozV
MKDFRRSFSILVATVLLLVVIGIAWEVMFAGRHRFPCTPTMEGTQMMPWMFWGGGMWIFPVIGLVVFLFVIYFVFTRIFPAEGRPEAEAEGNNLRWKFSRSGMPRGRSAERSSSG